VDESILTIKKNTEALLVAGNEIGLEANAVCISTLSCPETRMQDKTTTYRYEISPLKEWSISTVCE
jgi:hypothetical protein